MDSVTEFVSCGYVYAGTEQIPGGMLVRLCWPGRPTSCRHCGTGNVHSHGSRTRRLSHAPVGETPCDLLVSFHRFRCQSCRRVFTPKLPLLAARARISEGLRRFVCFAATTLKLSFEPLVRWLRVGWTTLRRCLPAAPDPLATASQEELRHLCLDEVFFCEPRRYQTVLSCASGRVLGLEEGRGDAPSRRLLMALPPQLREQVETLASDLNYGQRRAALACLPNAVVCADHFHLVRLLRKTMREAAASQRHLLSPAVRQLRSILKGNDTKAVDRWLDQWLEQGPAALQSLYGTIEKWQLEIESAIETKRSTGPAEALNRKIALLRRLACGYTNLNNFRQRILWLNFPSHHQE